MSLTREQLRKHLAAREIEPVYVLYGTETYLRDLAAKAITEACFGEGDFRDFNDDAFSLNTPDNIRTALAAADQLPMMAARRAVTVTPQQRAALISVGAAAALVVLKLVVGLKAHSLGLVSEAAHSGVEGNFQTTGAVQGRLSQNAELTFYRIAQEALTNVVKHAHASRVDVLLEGRDDAVVLVVEDNGVGFDATGEGPRGGVGLAGMCERAALLDATVHVESTPGNGTSVYLRCPVQSGDATPT